MMASTSAKLLLLLPQLKCVEETREGLVKWTSTLAYKYSKMLLDVDMLGLFSVELGWVAPQC